MSVVTVDVFIQNLDEFSDDLVAFKCGEEPAVYINWRFWFFKCSRKGYADVRVFRFPGAIYHTPHHCHLHRLHPRMAGLPLRHLLPEIGLNLIGHLLEEAAGGAATAGTGRDLRSEAADAQSLQNLLRN